MEQKKVKWTLTLLTFIFVLTSVIGIFLAFLCSDAKRTVLL